MGKENKRVAGRLSAVSAELAQATEAAAVHAALQGAAADDLFMIDASNKKRRRSLGHEDQTSTKRRKGEDGSAGIISASALVEDALAAVANVSKAKFLAIKAPKPLVRSRAEEKLLTKTQNRLTTRDPLVEHDQQLLKRAERGMLRTLSKDGGYNLTDVWASGGGKSLTSSRPLARGTLATPSVAGTSYHPSVEAHQTAVAAAEAEEEAREARRALLLHKTRGIHSSNSAGWDAEAEAAAHVFMSGLAGRDPDKDEEDEVMGLRKSEAPAAAIIPAAAAPIPGVPGLSAKAKAKAKSWKKKKRDDGLGGTVEDAKAALQKEEEAALAKRAARVSRLASAKSCVHAGLNLPFARALRETVFTHTAVPASDELTGSLRTMKPLGASSIVMDAMATFVARGDAPGRRVTHAPMREDLASGTFKNVPFGTLRRVKKIGKPYKELEFPRRKQFEPAMEAAKAADAEKLKAKLEQQAKESAKASERKQARIEAARAVGL